jgi:hypothetical protein
MPVCTKKDQEVPMNFADPRLTELRMRGIPFRPLLDSPELRIRLAQAGAAPATRPRRGLLDFPEAHNNPWPDEGVLVTGAARSPEGDPVKVGSDVAYNGPGFFGTTAGAAIGSGLPILRKPPMLGASGHWTSPASIAARMSDSEHMHTPRVKTPTISSKRAEAATLGKLLGRGFPLVGVPMLAADVAMSENPWRTAAGNAFGVLGGGAGAFLGAFGGPLAPVTVPASAAAGSLGANAAGLWLYDQLAGEHAHGSGRGYTGRW